MKNLLIVVVLIVLVFSFSSSLTKAEEEKPEVKDETKYDLSTNFTKDMKWKEIFEGGFSQESSSSRKSDKYKMSAEVIITEMKESKPTKLKYKDFGGKRYVSYEDLDDDSRNRADEEEIEKEDKEYELDEFLRITSLKIRRMYDFNVMYPCGSIIGFESTTKAIKVGDEWNSTKLIPLNLHLLGLEATDVESKFKLKEVKKAEDSSNAIITWTGKFKMPVMKEVSMEFKWSGEINFDLVNKRINSMKCVTEGEFDGRKMKFEASRKLEYVTEEAPEEKPEVDPKNSEDE